jgi:hypothetical protein
MVLSQSITCYLPDVPLMQRIQPNLPVYKVKFASKSYLFPLTKPSTNLHLFVLV